MNDKFRLTYANCNGDDLTIYHVKNGQCIGLPIAFVRQGMHKSAQYLIDCANGFKTKSIWTRNNRPGVE